ncbi:MAG: glycoside hydrolase family 16 protein [Bacteroidota bacterium]
MRLSHFLTLLFPLFLFVACDKNGSEEQIDQKKEEENVSLHLTAANLTLEGAGISKLGEGEEQVLQLDSVEVSIDHQLDVPQAGRYRMTLQYKLAGTEKGSFWVEDYTDNKDGRVYNISGYPALVDGGAEEWSKVVVDGSPMNKGPHAIRLHLKGKELVVKDLEFSLMKSEKKTPESLTQKMDGDNWELVWSDEFEGEGAPDMKKWTYDVGNWGWGNAEPQYYTDNRRENARLENGYLVMVARKNDMGQPWTSARLTTREKVSFLYGKIEFRAKVPTGDGSWAAGWLLGDDYVDELSWPYCGEIDVLECIGSEIDDETGDGINHASCHTRAYYFKNGNHITNTIPVKDMDDEFHNYTFEWYPDVIKGYLDGEHYYTYDKTANELEWPFNKPQTIIINLAMGGGMGGEIDPDLTTQTVIWDYVRVYQKN